MSNLAIKLLAFFAPFTAPFLIPNFRWMGAIMVTLLLLLIVVPSTVLPIMANDEHVVDQMAINKVVLSELVLVLIYFCFWITVIVLSFTKFQIK
jgi:hypothetical protein